MDDINDLDLYLGDEVLLTQYGEHRQSDRVIIRTSDRDENPVGTYDGNTILETRLYYVMFPYGAIQKYSANIIAENLYSQVNEDGHRNVMIDEIIDYTSDKTAVRKEDGFFTHRNGRKHRKITKKGGIFW